MQVVFTQDIPSVARKGEVKTVKDGYFRNYLLPKGLAEMATAAKIRLSEEQMKKVLIEKERIVEKAGEIKKKLKGLKISLIRKAKGEKLYGSISEKDLIDTIKKEINVGLEKKHIVLKEPIKTLGSFEVKVVLAEGVEGNVLLEVVAEE